MTPPANIAFLLDAFEPASPARHLLDRFLIGHPDDGHWRPRGNRAIVAVPQPGAVVDTNALDRRSADLGLRRAANPEVALRDADAAVVIPQGAGIAANMSAIEAAIAGLRAGKPLFVYGALGNDLAEARRLVAEAAKKNIPLAVGSALSAADRLPATDIPLDSPMKEALVVVQGSFGAGEFAGLECLLPLIERRWGGEAGINRVHRYQDGILWGVARAGRWPRHLLAPALSRSHSPQGAPVRDGRTQDLVGLNLVEKLAASPRGWVIEHKDGFRSTILVLDGVVADFNFAIEMKDGSVLSAQIHQPPRPNEENYSRLAAEIEDFFTTGKPPWNAQRAVLSAHLRHLFLNLSLLGGTVTDVSALRPPVAYRIRR